MNAFIDTNVSIAYIFKLDSLNTTSQNVFKEYENLYISNFVKKETEKVFVEKRDTLTYFFYELLNDLKSQNCLILSIDELENYLNKLKLNGKEKEKIKSSLKKFWLAYINEKFPNNKTLQNGIFNCLNDLDIFIFNKKEDLENILKITENRKNKYSIIKRELKRLHLHEKDIEIILDAHDHNLKTEYNLDFVTFDNDFYKGASKIKELRFNKIKGRYDFFTKLN